MYLGRDTVADRQTALELLALQQLDVDISDAHNRWLEKVRAAVEGDGWEWNRANFLRYSGWVE